MKTSKAQLEASKKYLEKKDRINVVLGDYQRDEIEYIIKEFGYYGSVPEFIREAISYYVNLHKALGDIPSMSVVENYVKFRKISEQ